MVIDNRFYQKRLQNQKEKKYGNKRIQKNIISEVDYLYFVTVMLCECIFGYKKHRFGNKKSRQKAGTTDRKNTGV